MENNKILQPHLKNKTEHESDLRASFHLAICGKKKFFDQLTNEYGLSDEIHFLHKELLNKTKLPRDDILFGRYTSIGKTRLEIALGF